MFKVLLGRSSEACLRGGIILILHFHGAKNLDNSRRVSQEVNIERV
jgi:hypothetical protein